MNTAAEAQIETFSGLAFDLLDPKPEQILIEDIAHALSLLCRFTGHTKHHYSIAQHSYYASLLVPQEDALWALLHDASEAYLNDMNRPLKHFTKAGEEYRKIEDVVQAAICDKFGLNQIQPVSVHDADNAMLYAEKAQLMKPMKWATKWYKTEMAANVKIVEWIPRLTEKIFLRRFQELISGEA